ncbi:uncharacterized protein [Palaemon carinicauda]|uniref:uncharacterized protein n=1 Tax=Palaemon carinicauda TaxID=392227 RepID=UPI0035B57FD9
MIILMGIRDAELVQKLIALDANSPLQDFVTACRSYEAAKTATSAICGPPSQVCAVSAYRRSKKSSGKPPPSPKSSKPAVLCQYCARQHEPDKCPAANSTCKNCDHVGHWSRTLKSSSNSGASAVSNKQQDSRTSCRRLGSPSTISKTPKPICVLLSSGDVNSRIKMLPDTGADVTVIGQQHLDTMGISKSSLQPPPPNVTFTADGSPMSPALGILQATLTLGKRSCLARIQVHENVEVSLLSYGHYQELSIITPDFPKPILEVKHVNRCKELPISATTSPSAAKEYFLREFKDVLVSKEDLRTAPLKPMAGPLMRIYLKDGAVPFAIHTPRQIPFAFKDQVKEEGPMGFAATGNAFCLRGDMALQGFQNCVKVIDDLLLYDEDYVTHLQRIHEVLTRCRKFGITLNKDKFVVAAPSVNFCGYTLSGDGISVDHQKVSAIKDFPTPASLTDLRSFMGLVNQLAEFTPDISVAAQPLRPLMSPKRTFVWTSDHDEAFQRINHPTQEDEISDASSAAHLRTVIAMNTVTLSDESSAQDADRILQDLSDAARTDPSVVVPAALRRRTLSHLHDSHRGVEATKRRARQSVFWPGIDSDIANTVGACEACQTLQPSQQQEPLLNDDNPTRPFESVSADFFVVAGKSFLVVVDRLSGWPVVVPCKGDTTASNTIRIFCRYFREVGVPLRLRTDGGPQFTSAEFKDFMKRWGVRHMVTSPHYPQSNGHAEAAVKSIKHLILKTAPSGNIDNEDFDCVLLELRNTPNFTGCSPAQILYGRPLRSCIPAHPNAFSKEWQVKSEDCDRRAAASYEQVKTQYDQHAHSLPKLSVGHGPLPGPRKRVLSHHSSCESTSSPKTHRKGVRSRMHYELRKDGVVTDTKETIEIEPKSNPGLAIVGQGCF